MTISGDYKTYHELIDGKSELTEQKKKVYKYKSMELRNDDGEVSGLTFRMKLNDPDIYEDNDYFIFDEEMLKTRLETKAYLHEDEKGKKKNKIE